MYNFFDDLYIYNFNMIKMAQMFTSLVLPLGLVEDFPLDCCTIYVIVLSQIVIIDFFDQGWFRILVDVVALVNRLFVG